MQLHGNFAISQGQTPAFIHMMTNNITNCEFQYLPLHTVSSEYTFALYRLLRENMVNGRVMLSAAFY